MTTTHIDLLRHGQPEGEHCFRGVTDFALMDEGLQQMYSAVANRPDYDLVITSPLSRCLRFAQEYSEKQGVELEQDQRLVELDFGLWDGVDKQTVWQQDQDLLSHFWSHPWQSSPPEGESMQAYDDRIMQAWHELLSKHKGKRILLVTHGGVIKQIMRHLLQMPKTAAYLQRLNIPYAACLPTSIYHDEEGSLWPQLHWPDVK